MGKVQTLIGPQVTELYEQTMAEIDTLRVERKRINDQLRDLVADAQELRKYVRLFDPERIRPLKRLDNGDEQ
jgi:uncharacterized coiled-coil DUF342 family protein